MSQQPMQNCKHNITCVANSVEVVHEVNDIIRIVKDRERFE